MHKKFLLTMMLFQLVIAMALSNTSHGGRLEAIADELTREASRCGCRTHYVIVGFTYVPGYWCNYCVGALNVAAALRYWDDRSKIYLPAPIEGYDDDQNAVWRRAEDGARERGENFSFDHIRYVCERNHSRTLQRGAGECNLCTATRRYQNLRATRVSVARPRVGQNCPCTIQ
jgi:hypothetical protein